MGDYLVARTLELFCICLEHSSRRFLSFPAHNGHMETGLGTAGCAQCVPSSVREVLSDVLTSPRCAQPVEACQAAW